MRLGRGGMRRRDGSAVVGGASQQETIFASQGDAESWLGENWHELVDGGVDQVTLFDDTRKEYGPMSLHPECLRHHRKPDVLHPEAWRHLEA